MLVVLLILDDLKFDMVDFLLIYDEWNIELIVLLSKFLNLFVNGFSGIVVSMVILIFFYNLGEVCDVLVMLLDCFELMVDEIMIVLFGFDFFIGGIICGCVGII